MGDVMILKTGRLLEANMLLDALERARVPHYRREESFSGVQFAMPAFPAQGPGVFFSVYVPEIAADHARQIMNHLPIEPEHPGVWSFRPKPWAKKLITAYAVAALLVLALQGLVTIMAYVLYILRVAGH